MNWSPDDPRLTAYVMGELSGAELAEVEAAIQTQPELRKAVEEIRAATAIFKEAYRAENKYLLDLDQRQKVMGIDKIKKRSSRTFGLALATVAAGMASIVIFTTQQKASFKKVDADGTISTDEVVAEFLAQRNEALKEEQAQKAPEKKIAVSPKKEVRTPAPSAAPAPRDNYATEVSALGASGGEADYEDEIAATEESVADTSTQGLVHKGRAAKTEMPLKMKSGARKVAFELSVQDEAALGLLKKIEPEVRRCLKDAEKPTNGAPRFAIDPVNKKVIAPKILFGSAAIDACVMDVLNGQEWPGTRSYSLTIRIH